MTHARIAEWLAAADQAGLLEVWAVSTVAVVLTGYATWITFDWLYDAVKLTLRRRAIQRVMREAR